VLPEEWKVGAEKGESLSGKEELPEVFVENLRDMEMVEEKESLVPHSDEREGVL
jgi:hypothetical protein